MRARAYRHVVGVVWCGVALFVGHRLVSAVPTQSERAAQVPERAAWWCSVCVRYESDSVINTVIRQSVSVCW